MTHDDMLEERLRELAAPQPEDDELRRRIRDRLQQPLPAPRPHRRRWPIAAGVAAAAAAAAVALAGTSGGPGAADAAVLHRTLAAVTPSGGTILHVKLLDTSGQFVFESWNESDAPYAYRFRKGPIGATGEEGQDQTTSYTYDPSSNTIDEQPASSHARPSDPVTAIRDQLANGQAHVDGTSTIDGRELYTIDLASGMVAYVDESTDVPAYLDDPQRNGRTLRFKVVTYERLDETPANLQLLSITAQHPDAQIATSAAPTTSTGK